MRGLIGMPLSAGTGLLIFVYVLFPVESSRWVAAHLRAHSASFCETAPGVAPSRFHLNKGQCGNIAEARNPDAQLDDLWTSIRTVLTQRAAR